MWKQVGFWVGMLGSVATIVLAFEQSKWIQMLPEGGKVVASAVFPYLPSVIYLCIFFLLLRCLSKVSSLEKEVRQEQEKRTSDFNTWIENRSRQVSDFFEARINRLTGDAETLKRQVFENLDRFYKTYDGRLRDVETLSDEGPWVPLPIGDRTIKLTEAAHKEYVAWNDETRTKIVAALSWLGEVRFHRDQVRRAAGAVHKLEHGHEWFYHEVAAMTDEERGAFFKREPALWRWYEEQTLRRQGSA